MIIRFLGTHNAESKNTRLVSFLIDGIVYPQFASEASFLQKATIQLVPVEFFERQNIEGYEVMAVPVQHPLGGEVWIGAETYNQAKDYLEVEELEPQSFKGKAEPVAVYRVTGLRTINP